MATERVILVLNSGSSSLKYAVFRSAGSEQARIAAGTMKGTESDVDTLFDRMASGAIAMPDAVGHRIVHGGPHHLSPERIDRALLTSLRKAVPFAPVHLPAELRWIDAVAARYPELAQVACFDTAFHRRLPELARRFALPSSLYEAGVRRYGFHGLSYEYVVDKLGPAVGGRSIIAHLGNGASMVALVDRKPIDTTMGLTPAGGFMMGTRTGDLDPGVLLYLLRSGKTVHDLEKLVDQESGLLGVSGSTSDMKELLQRRAGDDRADLAFEMFCYQARKTVGALVAALGGLDTLVFTGGIGERAAPVRERICAGLECLGVRIDRTRNEEAKDVISPADSPCIVRVCATDEELTIAKHTYRLLFSAAHPFPE